MPTKYAEWITQPCGKCRLNVDIGSIIEDDIDPTCDDHREFECVVCGRTASATSISHGSLDPSTWHKPVEGNLSVAQD